MSTALLFALMGWHFGWSWELIAHCALLAGLLSLTWIDVRTKRLPRQITYTTSAIVVPLLCVAAIARDEQRRMWMMALGAAIALALMMLIYVASRGGMGDGDVRLSPLLGAALGYHNPGLAAVGLFFGFLTGAVVGVVAMVVTRGGRKMAIPFGPFLALGTVVALFVGQRYIDLVLVR